MNNLLLKDIIEGIERQELLHQLIPKIINILKLIIVPLLLLLLKMEIQQLLVLILFMLDIEKNIIYCE